MANLTVWWLGDMGVNAAADVLHRKPGEFDSAQNATFVVAGLRGGIGKRQGLRPITGTALGATVMAMLGVTIADPSPGNLLTEDGTVVIADDSDLVLIDG